MSELNLHFAVKKYLDLALPPNAFYTTIAHGGFRLPINVARKLKNMGLKAGVPDILVVYRGIAIFIELKNDKGSLSPAQRETIARLSDAGSRTFLCRSIEEVEGTLRAFMPLKAAA